MRSILYATSNPGKLEEVGRFVRLHGYTLLSPVDLEGEIDVPETGSTLEENALLKVNAYKERYPDIFILADDTGVEIAGLNGEPGIFVRRWKDKVHHMSDQEIIDYCLERMKDLHGDARKAQMRTVIALAEPGKEIQLFDGVLPGFIVEKAEPLTMEGFPFEVLFFSTEYQMMLSEMHALPDDEKKKMLTHRERAVEKALQYIESVA